MTDAVRFLLPTILGGVFQIDGSFPKSLATSFRVVFTFPPKRSTLLQLLMYVRSA